jgi:hypothetical protein
MDAIVLAVTDIDLVVIVQAEVVRALEAPRLDSVTAPGLQELAI